MKIMTCPICNDHGYTFSLYSEDSFISIKETLCSICDAGEYLEEERSIDEFTVAPELVMRIM